MFTEQEIQQICGGSFSKQKTDIFNQVENLTTEWISRNRQSYTFSDLGSYTYLDLKEFSEDCKKYVADHINTKSLGLSYIILWWIIPYIIDYIVDKLIEKLK